MEATADGGCDQATGLDPGRARRARSPPPSASASSSRCAAISGLPLYQTEQTGYPHVVVPLITGPLGFLAGFGCFDYWLRWAAGMPTIPDDHSQHGAKSWKDYFRFNTDHKVIGIQYICTTFFFFFVGGLMAMLIRAELAQPGTQIVDAGDLQQPLLHPRGADDLRLRDPGLRRDRELRPAADDRRAGHGLPAPQRAQLLDAAAGRAALHRQLPRPGRRLRRRLDRLRAALDRGAAGAVVLQPRRPVRRRLLDRDRAQLPGHDHHHAGAGDDLLADAAAGLGQPLDLAAGRRRDAVHRRRPVHGPLRPRPAHQLLPVRRPAAT